jgi:hypothetical protein
MPSKVEIISVEELEVMHTGSLMKRREALLKCEESLSLSDRADMQHLADSRFIEFKDSDTWKQSYNELKVVLSTRENILNKKERKAIRQERAKTSR